jgi:hypothetical protein
VDFSSSSRPHLFKDKMIRPIEVIDASRKDMEKELAEVTKRLKNPKPKEIPVVIRRNARLPKEIVQFCPSPEIIHETKPKKRAMEIRPKPQPKKPKFVSESDHEEEPIGSLEDQKHNFVTKLNPHEYVLLWRKFANLIDPTGGNFVVPDDTTLRSYGSSNMSLSQQAFCDSWVSSENPNGDSPYFSANDYSVSNFYFTHEFILEDIELQKYAWFQKNPHGFCIGDGDCLIVTSTLDPNPNFDIFLLFSHKTVGPISVLDFLESTKIVSPNETQSSVGLCTLFDHTVLWSKNPSKIISEILRLGGKPVEICRTPMEGFLAAFDPNTVFQSFTFGVSNLKFRFLKRTIHHVFFRKNPDSIVVGHGSKYIVADLKDQAKDFHIWFIQIGYAPIGPFRMSAFLETVNLCK